LFPSIKLSKIKEGGDAGIKIIEDLKVPEFLVNIMKALSNMGNLAKVIEGRSSGTKVRAHFVGVLA